MRVIAFSDLKVPTKRIAPRDPAQELRNVEMKLYQVLMRDPSALLKQHSFGELKLMVLKHAPLGEINHPFVASSAIIPRCRRRPMLIPHRRRNRRQIENRTKLA